MPFFTTPRRTYSKTISCLSKLTPGITIQHSSTRIEEAEQGIDADENTSTIPESSMVQLEHSSAYTMKKYHYQRSTKIPLREPAQFPISQSFSQRVIIESDGDKPHEKIVTDAYPTTHQQNSIIATQSDPSTRRQVSTSRLERAIKGFVPWPKKQSMTVSGLRFQKRTIS
ncbi:hypothetical protein CROQUDRAFT_673087 [Cronartium quercuum f. sp. fusiforme G11]|uniref:Uncharacterized protein n=1 Tax=Cronartium quercuum f. sp. fusiforme G11 TaxID=708437 RepID=A0A9P6NAY1_9BASI|nr:hypothetical protein CROQUDRAFT_673087 [Cronartium quercuum f. sp. fusiforme G11]